MALATSSGCLRADLLLSEKQGGGIILNIGNLYPFLTRSRVKSLACRTFHQKSKRFDNFPIADSEIMVILNIVLGLIHFNESHS